MVTNQQLYLAVGIPLLFNATLVAVLIAFMNAKFQAVDAKFQALEAKFEGRFQALETRMSALEQRFQDLRDLWRAELHRVEEVLDARLRHLEERL